MKRNLVPICTMFVLLLTMVVPATPAAGRGPSTAQEKAYARTIAADLEAHPLGKQADAERKAMLLFIIQIPDVSVTLCGELIDPMTKPKYRYASKLEAQDMISTTVFVFDNPNKANDEAAKQLAGVRGMLKAYRSILRQEPKAHCHYLDHLLDLESNGNLPTWVRAQTERCLEKQRSPRQGASNG